MSKVKRYWHKPGIGFAVLDPQYYEDESGYVAYEDYAALEAENARLREGQGDAENYRWLRGHHNDVSSDIGVYDGANILATQEGELDLDAAIAEWLKDEQT